MLLASGYKAWCELFATATWPGHDARCHCAGWCLSQLHEWTHNVLNVLWTPSCWGPQSKFHDQFAKFCDSQQQI